MIAKHTITGKLSLCLMIGITDAFVVSGCGAAMKSAAVDTRAIEEAFLTGTAGAINPDACAFWYGEDGSIWAITPDAASGTVVVYDAVKKTEVKRFGKPGAEKGQFGKPIDAVAADDMLFVLEEGNKRIQAFHLPDCQSFGFIGEGRFSSPNQIALYHIEHGAFYLYVADSEEYNGARIDHVLKFSASRAVDTIHSAYQVTFGVSSNTSVSPEILTLGVDNAARKVLATVTENGAKYSRVFTLDGSLVDAR